MTADELITQIALILEQRGTEKEPLQELFLHDAEGAPFAVVLPIATYREKVSWERMPFHDHLEPGMELP